MKFPSQPTLSAFGAILLAAAAASSASAQVIYDDTFNRTGDLNGSSPTTDTTGATYTQGNTGDSGYNTNQGLLSVTASYTSTFLPYNSAPLNSVITLSVTTSLAANTLQLGFYQQNSSGGPNYLYYNNNAPWVQLNGGSAQFVTSTSNDYFGVDTTGSHTYAIAYDTSGLGTTRFYIDGTLEKTVSGAQSYQDIGLTGIDSNAFVSNIDLTVVPEPVYTGLLGGLVCLGAFGLRLRFGARGIARLGI